MTAPPLRCILCGHRLRHAIEDEGHGERTAELVCAAHSDGELREMGQNELWGGVDPVHSAAFFTGGTAAPIGVWEQGPGGCFGVYVLLGDEQLLVFTSFHSEVNLARVPGSLRRLHEPVGVPRSDAEHWRRAVEERWILREVERLPGGEAAVRFDGHGTVLLSTERYSWRELGDWRHFLRQDWQPGGAAEDGAG